LNKGEKTKCIREAISALGLQAGRSDAQAWLKQKYGWDDVAESTFYNVRREMMLTNRFAEAPSIASLTDSPVSADNAPAKGGIVALIRQLKQIVSKVGKEEAKELIDIL